LSFGTAITVEKEQEPFILLFMELWIIKGEYEPGQKLKEE